MSAHVRGGATPVPQSLLWWGFLGGPIAWSAHLLASYPLVPWACAHGSAMVLNGITLGTLLLSLSASGAGALALRRVRAATGGVRAGSARMDADAASGHVGLDSRMDGRTGELAARSRPGAGDGGFDRVRFMAVCGVILGAFFAFVILVEGLPPLLQDPCVRAG